MRGSTSSAGPESRREAAVGTGVDRCEAAHSRSVHEPPKPPVELSRSIGENHCGGDQDRRSGPVAQLVRVPPCHGGGRRFKPGQGRPLAKAPEFSSGAFAVPVNLLPPAQPSPGQVVHGPSLRIGRAPLPRAWPARCPRGVPLTGPTWLGAPTWHCYPGPRPLHGGHGSVAQLVERSTENRKVTGSTPVGATLKTPAPAGVFSLPKPPVRPRDRGSGRTV